MAKEWMMPFGSMCNAYGQVSKEKEIDEFIKDVIRIQELAEEMSNKKEPKKDELPL